MPTSIFPGLTALSLVTAAWSTENATCSYDASERSLTRDL